MTWGGEKLAREDLPERPRVLSVNVSPGGKPKMPVARGVLAPGGFDGDGREHAKHYKPDRAVSLVDAEVFPALSGNGEAVGPGHMGENLTLRGVNVRDLPPGARLRFTGGVEIELTEPHKPCALPGGDDAETIVIGSMARVLTPGVIEPGAEVTVLAGETAA